MPPKREGTERGSHVAVQRAPVAATRLFVLGGPASLPGYLRAACRCVLDLQWHLPVAAQEHLFISLFATGAHPSGPLTIGFVAATESASCLDQFGRPLEGGTILSPGIF
jgi:hypothetical protein